ncbi:MAG: tetratricopeptide repeat protein [Roseivirga sp.]
MYRKYFLITILFVSLGSLKAQNTLYQSDESRYFDAGIELLDKDKYGAAREQFERYLKEGKDEIKRVDAEYYVAFCALNLDNADGAQLIAEFVKKRPNHPKAAKAYYNLGMVSFKNNDYQNTVKYLKLVNTSLLTAEERLEVNFKIGYASYGLRRNDEAAKYLDLAKRNQSPYYPHANYYSGHIAYQKGDFDKALVDFKRAEGTPQYKNRVPVLIVSSYYKQKRYGELTQYAAGFKDVQQFSRTTDYLYQIYQLAAESYYQEEQWAESVEFFKLYEQLAAQSADQQTLYRMGYANFMAGNSADAVNNFKKVALNSDTLAQYASYYLGQLYVQEKNFIFATSAFDKAAKLDFNKEIQEEAAFNLAKVSFQSGKFSQAIVSLDRFMKQYPTSDYVPEANNLISEAFLNTNDYARAIVFIEKIPNKSDRIKEAYQKVTFYKGTQFYNSAKYIQAVQLFDKSLKYTIDKDLGIAANFWRAEAYSTSRSYPQAIRAYRAVIQRRNRSSEYYQKANYGLAYAYYNSKDYRNARLYFKQYVDALERAADKQNYNDAILRLADCYYVEKEYASAISYYNRAINNDNPQKDYAYFQKGVVRDFQDKSDDAISELETVINRYSSSRYYDDAIFKKAQIHLENKDYRLAIQTFTRIIDNLKQSPFMPYAYEGRAQAYFNLEDYDKVKADYITILRDYMSSARVANSALLGLQNTLKLQNNVIEFNQWLDLYTKAYPDDDQIENIEFEAATSLYNSGDYNTALGAFANYEKNYPESGKIYEAKFYRAECHYRLLNVDQALELYYEVFQERKIRDMDVVYERIGELQLKQGDFQEAANFYTKLEEVKKNDRQENTAWSGLLESYYKLADYDKMRSYANKIIERGNVSPTASNRSQLYLGLAAYAQGDFDTAIDEFLSTINTAKDQFGAQAQYTLGLVFYQQKQYQQSLNTLFDINNFLDYDDWVGKSFLLIADNYIALKELFQAKATVNSIIENSPVASVVTEARAKLIEIEKLEASQNGAAADTTNNNGNN